MAEPIWLVNSTLWALPVTLRSQLIGSARAAKFIGTKTLDVAVKSATEALLTITDPKAASTVTLTNDTGQQVQTVVTRKTKPKE